MSVPHSLLDNRYRLLHPNKPLGKGGFGAVYEADDLRLKNRVAVKRYEPDPSVDNTRLRNMFEREARTLAELRHAALPHVLDFFEIDTTPYLVMQFIPGKSMKEMLDGQARGFPLSQVIDWAAQLLGVLDYPHAFDPPIIHRDVKPDNLKLTPDGVLVLLDFGIAKNEALVPRSRSGTGSMPAFTPPYAPLEQIERLGTDVRSDIYATAATLYHLLTGVEPADARERDNARRWAAPDPLIPINRLVPDLPQALASVLMRAMALKVGERTASAAEMLRQLRAALPDAEAIITQHFEIAAKRRSAESTTDHLLRAYDVAMQFYAAGAYEAAFPLIEEAAQAGLQAAQWQLGLLYTNGEGVQPDDHRAFVWYEKAAAQGHVLAQATLGSLYQEGRGVNPDENEAALWFLAAAQQEDTLSQAMLGVLYENGIGVEQNMKDAMQWYGRAAAQGSEEARKRLRRAAASGNDVARQQLAKLR